MLNNPNYGQISWASRRGMRELDLMLLPFVEHDLPGLDTENLDAYQDLLKASDLELLHWLSGSEKADTESRQRIVDIIRKAHAGRMGREGV